MPRVRIILEHGTARSFEPYDRYAMYEESRGRTIGELLDTFAALRAENITALRGFRLDSAKLGLQGHHPALGPVTLQQLLATWVVHDLNHIHQIAKCMAFQYADEVGPWRAYLTILPTR